MKRILKWSILIVLVLVIVAGLIVYFNLNRIVRSTVETKTGESLNLPTTLNSATLSLFGGSLSLDDLKIGSPKGYTAPEMITLGGIDVDVKYDQLKSEPVRVSSIVIRKPRLVIEQANGKLNFQTVVDQQTKDKPTDKDGKREQSEPIKLIIDKLKIADASVVIRPGLIPGMDQEIVVDIPTLELANIGNADGAQNGAAIKDVILTIVKELAAKASDAGNLTELAQKYLKDGVAHLGDQIGKEVDKQVGRITDNLTKDLPPEIGKPVGDLIKNQDAGKAIEKGFGNLLGGKKADKKDSDKPKSDAK